jgi:hypothetical protein
MDVMQNMDIKFLPQGFYTKVICIQWVLSDHCWRHNSKFARKPSKWENGVQPPNAEEVCVELEFTVSQISNFSLLMSWSTIFQGFSSHACYLCTTESLAIEDFVHWLHNRTWFLFAKLHTLNCFVDLLSSMTTTIVEKNLSLVVEILQVF